MNRIRPGTVLLLVLLLVLGYSLAIRQRREARLRAALALYRGRAQVDLDRVMGLNVDLDWPDGTSLSEAIERIKHSPSRRWGLFTKGVPIYVDADGLREAGQTLTSPLKAPPSDDGPQGLLSLRKKLRIILEPLGLACQVKDGAILITSRGRIEEGDPAVAADEDEE